MAKKPTPRRGKPKRAAQRTKQPPAKRGALPRGLSLEDVTHLAIIRLVCEGHKSELFKIDLSLLVEFGCYLLTPRAEGRELADWLIIDAGADVKRSAVYRYASAFRRSVRRVLDEYTRGAGAEAFRANTERY